MDSQLLIDKIIDFSLILKEDSNIITFNPSITHWIDDLYICSYRIVTGYKKDEQPLEIKENVYKAKNHPWYSKFGLLSDKTFYSKTKFVILKIDKNNNINLVKKLKPFFNNFLFCNKSQLEKVNSDKYDFLDLQDSRLIKFPKTLKLDCNKYQDTNIFFLYGNGFINDPKMKYGRDQSQGKILNNLQNCRDGCWTIDLYLFYINPDTFQMVFLTDKNTICLNQSYMFEKNWSLWFRPEDCLVQIGKEDILTFYLTYQIVSKNGYKSGHEVLKSSFNLQLQKLGEISSNSFKINENCVLLNQTEDKISLSNLIEQAFDKKLLLSGSTPSIIFSSEKDYREYLSVGHCKVFISNINNYKDSNLYSFYHNLKTFHLPTHWKFLYFFFFYTFKVSKDINNNNFVITKISPFFLPSPLEVPLIFPTGLEKRDKEFLISYGNYDTSTDILFVSQKEIENNLIKIKNITKNLLNITRDEQYSYLRKNIQFKFSNWSKNNFGNKVIL